MSIDDILKKINYIEPDLLGIRKELKDAMEIAKIRPDMSVASLRKITERILCDVYEKEYRHTPKDTIIQKVKNQLLSKGLLPRRIRNHVDTIQDFGNMSIHHTMEDLEAEDIETCFIALASIYKWYNDKYAKASSNIRTKTTEGEEKIEIVNNTSTNETESIKEIQPKETPKEEIEEEIPVEEEPDTISNTEEVITPEEEEIYEEDTSYETSSPEVYADKEIEETKSKKKGNPFVKFLIFLILAGGVFAVIYFFVIPKLFKSDTEKTDQTNDEGSLLDNSLRNTMNVSASVEDDDKTIKLEWDKVRGADKYIISKSMYHDPDAFQKVAETKTNSHILKDPNLSPGCLYYYKIEALNDKDKALNQSVVTKKLRDYPNRWVAYREQSKDFPQPRRNHSMTYLSGSKVLMFGGQGKNGLLNDTWTFDVETNRWTEIKEGERPDKREYYAMSYIDEGIVILFGGRNDNTNFDDTWIFDQRKGKWEKQNIEGESSHPSARAYHSMAYASKGLVVMFGGATKFNSNFMNDVWEYDLTKNKWTTYDTDLKPQERAYHSMADIDRNKVMLHGGYAFKSLSDAWIYDAEKHQWAMDRVNSAKNIQRHRHKLSKLSKNEILLFGGYVNNAQGDTYVYNRVKKSLELTNDSSQSIITPRHSHSMSFAGNSKVVVFGGYDNKNNYLNDVFVYSAY